MCNERAIQVTQTQQRSSSVETRTHSNSQKVVLQIFWPNRIPEEKCAISPLGTLLPALWHLLNTHWPLDLYTLILFSPQNKAGCLLSSLHVTHQGREAPREAIHPRSPRRAESCMWASSAQKTKLFPLYFAFSGTHVKAPSTVPGA